MREVQRCVAKSKRTGIKCGAAVLKKPDGTRTRHCYHHGGRNERAPKGDPIRGGSKPTLFLYASSLNQPGDAELIEAALKKVGTLDDEIALSRRNLVRFSELHAANARGGIPISVSGPRGSVTLHTYEDIVAQYLDRIGRLEEKRARIIAMVGGGDRDHADVDRVLARMLGRPDPAKPDEGDDD